MSAVTAAHKHNEGSRQNTEYVAHKRTSEDSAAAKTSSSLGIFTVPNFISFLRLCLVPVFIWLLVRKHNYVAAFVLLMIIGISDWADGKIARYWHIESKIGAYLDPAADRLMTIAVPISMAVVHFVPWWMVIVLICRDVILAGIFFIYQNRGLRMSVIYLGKVATASLMVAFPTIIFANLPYSGCKWAIPLGWAVFIWAFVLYVWTGLLYIYRGYLLAKKVPVLTPEEKAQWRKNKNILNQRIVNLIAIQNHKEDAEAVFAEYP